jgi:hypothetical protein
VDPHAVLGLDPGASIDEVQRAYRDLAKRFHPDRAGGAGGEEMASINAAYDLLRDRLVERHGNGVQRPRPPGTGGSGSPSDRSPDPPRQGDWLSPAVRAVLARELLGALEPGEQVDEVLLTSMSDSTEVQLVVTDRRLLWLRDDAIMGRVRSLRYRDVALVESRGRGRWRRNGELRVRTRNGRRMRFFDLRPDVLARVVPAIAARVTR